MYKQYYNVNLTDVSVPYMLYMSGTLTISVKVFDFS